jgi:hypothetical protein
VLEVINPTAAARRPLVAVTLGRAHWTLVPLFIFAASQAVAFLAFMTASGGAYGSFIDRWDGSAYRWIAREGYITEAGGHTDAPAFEGLWAFHPLYPMLVRSVMALTPLGWDVAAPLVSLAAGAGAVAVLFRMLMHHVGRVTATVAVVMLCTWMAAPVMQMAYTESVALLLLACAISFLIRRRYLALIVTLGLLALCRPVAVPFAAVVTAHVVTLWKRGASRSDVWRALGVLAACPALAALWPALAGIMSGRPTAYFDSMAAWGGEDVPRSWLFWAIEVGAGGWLPYTGITIAAVWAAVRVIPGPIELRTWAAAYPLYILAATYTSGSIFRYLLLAFPAALVWAPLANKGVAGRAGLAVVAVSGVALGVVWVHYFVGGTGGPIP